MSRRANVINFIVSTGVTLLGILVIVSVCNQRYAETMFDALVKFAVAAIVAGLVNTFAHEMGHYISGKKNGFVFSAMTVWFLSGKKLTAKLNELSSLSVDNTEAISTYNRNIEQLRTIVNLEDKVITEAVFRSIISKIEVYNCHILKLYITFLDKPIIMQYKTVGRNDGYKISFTVLNPDEFEALR